MTEYELEGEIWIPFHDVKRLYKVQLDELTILVEEEKIRFRTFLNSHNDRMFKAYSLIDLDEYLPKKGKVKLEAQWF